jgi:osmotically inducible protein OsmC
MAVQTAIERRAHATWEGDLKSGSGKFDLQSSGAAEALEVTFASRFEEPGGKTSPEELIAAAHATCFSMALSNGLAQDGHAPTRVETDAVCTLDRVDGGFRITTMRLTVRGEVDGIDDSTFKQAAAQARDNCPVSQALARNVEIQVDAFLGSGSTS